MTRSHLALSLLATSWTLLECSAAHAYSPLPVLLSPQILAESRVSVQAAGHTAPPNDYEDHARLYLDSAVSTDLADRHVAAMDPVSGITSGTGAALGRVGSLMGSAGASASSLPPPGSSAVHASASGTTYSNLAFSDLLTIDSPGLAGKAGMVHASIWVQSSVTRTLGGPDVGMAGGEGADGSTELHLRHYDWTYVSGGEGPGGWAQGTQYEVARFSSNIMDTRYESFDPSSGLALTSYEGGQVGRTRIDILVPFTFGQVFGIDAYVDVQAQAGASAPALPPTDPNYPFPRFAQSNASFSMQWGGIDSVTLATPARTGGLRAALAPDPLTYTVISGSGANYAQAISAVPEPPMAVLFAAGLLPLAGILRRRQRMAGGRMPARTLRLPRRRPGPARAKNLRSAASLALAWAAFMAAPAEATPVLQVGSAVVDVGSTFTIDVSVVGASDLQAFQFDLWYDSSRLRLLGFGDAGTAFETVADTGFGLLGLTGFELPGGVSGVADAMLGVGPGGGLVDGVIATFLFEDIAAGYAAINAEAVFLNFSDQDVSVNGGSVTNPDSRPLPAPPTIWLTVVAVCAMHARRGRARHRGPQPTTAPTSPRRKGPEISDPRIA